MALRAAAITLARRHCGVATLPKTTGQSANLVRKYCSVSYHRLTSVVLGAAAPRLGHSRAVRRSVGGRVRAAAAAVPPLEGSSSSGGRFIAGHTPMYDTEVLVIDPDVLPVVASLDCAAAAQVLAADVPPPDLGPSSCPHLYYSLPPHLEVSPQGEGDAEQTPSASASAAAPGVTSSSAAVAAAALARAAQLLRRGEPVALPTETVYGLAANALDASAVARVFQAKGRPSDNPLIVHISDLGMLDALYPPCCCTGQASGDDEQPINASSSSSSSGMQAPAADGARGDVIAGNNSSSSSRSGGAATPPAAVQRTAGRGLPPQYHRLVAALWPGPLTLLLPASPLIPAAVTAGAATLAVRMPAHPVARALIAAAGVPLAAPSANVSGRPSPTSAAHVLHDLAGRVPAVVDGGPCGCGVESTVLDGLRVPPAVLRPGGVPTEVLAAAPEMAGIQVYNRDFTDAALEAAPTTPGMKYRHYSPRASLLLLDPSIGCGSGSSSSIHSGDTDADTMLLQARVRAATQELLASLSGAHQRIVLISTCGGVQEQPAAAAAAAAAGGGDSESAASGWTAASTAALQHQTGVGAADAAVVLEYVLGRWEDPAGIAQRLFAGLRAADEAGADVIIVQGVPPTGAGHAVMNRLQKAASQRLDVQ